MGHNPVKARPLLVLGGAAQASTATPGLVTCPSKGIPSVEGQGPGGLRFPVLLTLPEHERKSPARLAGR